MSKIFAGAKSQPEVGACVSAQPMQINYVKTTLQFSFSKP
jgi:hypothetical protein